MSNKLTKGRKTGDKVITSNSSMDNNNNANLLNITCGKYPKLCEKNMTRKQ